MVDRPTGAIAKLVNEKARTAWHQLPSLTLQLANLSQLRVDLREKNLFEVDGARPDVDLGEPTEAQLRARTSDGTFNDLSDPLMGAAGTAFGRNVPLRMTTRRPPVGSPNPREISNLLLARDTFAPAGIINTLAAAWLQFMNHTWFFHERGLETDYYEVPLPEGDTWPEEHLRIRKTPVMPGHDREGTGGAAPAYWNTESHWWDGSQIYGTGDAKQKAMRTFVDGKLKVDESGRRLLQDEETGGIDQTGFNENWWAGLALFHTVFTLEHNAICDALKKAYPGLDDQRLFEIAVLVNSALMAKIHTIDWTRTILRHPALQIGMNANWWGFQGERSQKAFGRLTSSEVLSGVAGSTAAHHAAPFALTEEFVSVYRMHPLIPDDYDFYSIEGNALRESRTLTEIQGSATREFVDRMGLEDIWYSLGMANAGAVQLKNYPNTLRQLQRIDGEMVDLATLDILRDRERGIPRYNDFREALRMPRVRSFEELTPNQQWAKEISEVYKGDIDAVDPMVGMYAETPPKGFGFSDTAFRVFILMASRRIKSDRFFTEDFRPEVYTKVGFDWVQETSMKDVLLRHLPDLAPALENVDLVFAPWPKVGDPKPKQPHPVQALVNTVKDYLP